MDMVDHVNFKIVNSICYIGLAIQSMNVMVHKCEDPTKRNITIYRRNCVHDNEQYSIIYKHSSSYCQLHPVQMHV